MTTTPVKDAVTALRDALKAATTADEIADIRGRLADELDDLRNREEAALLRVLAEPDSDRRRLEYADACGDVKKANTILVHMRGGVQWVRLQHLVEFEQVLGCQSHQAGRHAQPGMCAVHNPERTVTLTWRRGFISEVACPATVWFEHGGDLTARHPVEVVRLTTVPRIEVGHSQWPDGERLCKLAGQPDRTRLPFIANSAADAPRIALALLRFRWPTVREWHLPDA